jgi:signal transduction histidine kinase
LSLRLEEIVATDDLAVAHEEAALALEQVRRLADVSAQVVAAARGSRPSAAAPFAVDTLTTAAMAEWQPLYAAAGRDLVVTGAAGLTATATIGAQSQVLGTLLENSMLHGGGATTVHARAAGEWVVLEVGDQGTGVPPEVAGDVFERGVSGERSSGAGLGLSLARTLVAADGGKIELIRAVPAAFALFLPGGDHADEAAIGDSQRIGAASSGSFASTGTSRKTQRR